jgi:hypothetical protein
VVSSLGKDLEYAGDNSLREYLCLKQTDWSALISVLGPARFASATCRAADWLFSLCGRLCLILWRTLAKSRQENGL